MPLSTHFKWFPARRSKPVDGVGFGVPEIDPDAPLLFVINKKSGHNDSDQTRRTIQEVVVGAGRPAEFLSALPGQLPRVAHEAAAKAVAMRTAVIAVGGDGTISAVAQAAHVRGCAMGLIPQGTFNYFARTHGIPADVGEATHSLLRSRPQAVQVGLINDRVFLVNASIGFYPQLLEDREAYKKRFGRSRLVALASFLITLLTHRHALRLRIESGATARNVVTPTLFVGNNRLQLEQVGVPEAHALDEGWITAVILRPIGVLAMLSLFFRGALGTLGEADTVESFKFRRMLVRQRRGLTTGMVKVAFDGEVKWLRGPLEFQVAPRPLYLIKPFALDAAPTATPAAIPAATLAATPTAVLARPAGSPLGGA